MSHPEEKEDLLKNEETLRRRAWVDQAISSVRARLEQPLGHAPQVDDRNRSASRGASNTASQTGTSAGTPVDRRPQLFVLPVRKRG